MGTFAELCQLEPGLGRLLAEAIAARKSRADFDALRPVFLGRLRELVGPGRRPRHEILSAKAAYETARAALISELAAVSSWRPRAA